MRQLSLTLQTPSFQDISTQAMHASRLLGLCGCVLFAGSPASVCGQTHATGSIGPSVGIGLELAALEDMNTDHPLPDMSKHRQGELDALTSTRFTEALEASNVSLTTYRELIAKHGLTAMRRPAG
ncbi:MAG: hypothetical protein ACREMJ_06225 [Gemmatimonadales bacterium]